MVSFVQLSAFLLCAAVADAAVTFPTPSARDTTITTRMYNFNHALAVSFKYTDELSMKMEKMAASAFSFYRGTAHLFYDDMAAGALWNVSSFANPSTNEALLEGDAHVANFGAFENANSDVVFDYTDFDETYRGSYLWDLRRLAVSIVLAMRELGLDSASTDAAVNNLGDWYLNKMGDFKGTTTELGYVLKSADTSSVAQDTIAAAATKSRSDLLAKWTLNGKFITTNANLTAITNATFYSAVSSALSSSAGVYRSGLSSTADKSNSYYLVKDIRRRMFAGTGSLGRLRLYVLIDGPSTANSDDRILEVKLEVPSAVARAGGPALSAAVYKNHEGRRAFIGYKAMLSAVEPLAGYATIDNQPYFVRERVPKQEDFDYTLLVSGTKYGRARAAGGLGWRGAAAGKWASHTTPSC